MQQNEILLVNCSHCDVIVTSGHVFALNYIFAEVKTRKYLDFNLNTPFYILRKQTFFIQDSKKCTVSFESGKNSAFNINANFGRKSIIQFILCNIISIINLRREP